MEYVRRLTFRRSFPIPSLYRSAKQKNHLPMFLQTEYAHKKKIPASIIPTDFYSVGDITMHRRLLSVGKLVGELLKYRQNIPFVNSSVSYNTDGLNPSVNLLVSHETPIKFICLEICRWWSRLLSYADEYIPSVNPFVIYFFLFFYNYLEYII